MRHGRRHITDGVWHGTQALHPGRGACGVSRSSGSPRVTSRGSAGSFADSQSFPWCPAPPFRSVSRFFSRSHGVRHRTRGVRHRGPGLTGGSRCWAPAFPVSGISSGGPPTLVRPTAVRCPAPPPRNPKRSPEAHRAGCGTFSQKRKRGRLAPPPLGLPLWLAGYSPVTTVQY